MVTDVNLNRSDNDPLNNSLENLVILSKYEHRWIHVTFGVATLYAVSKGKVSAEEASSWCVDPALGLRLLTTNLLTQKLEDLGPVDGKVLRPPLLVEKVCTREDIQKSRYKGDGLVRTGSLGHFINKASDDSD